MTWKDLAGQIGTDPRMAAAFATLLGLWAAGLYWLYQLFAGHRVVSISARLTVNRQRKSSLEDYLALELTLKGGERASIALHDVLFRLHPEPGSTIPVSQERCGRIERLDSDRPRGLTGAFSGRRFLLDVTRINPVNPFLNLAPKDEIAVSHLLVVDRRIACVIEVVILGRVGRLLRSANTTQWRTSCTSLPMPEKERNARGPPTGVALIRF